MAIQYAFYADDFTGATDTLATLSQAQKKAILFLKVPSDKQLSDLGELDAVGIAGAARSMTNQMQLEELTQVASWLSNSTAQIIHYKVCSTFDSASNIGSIGLAVNTLKQYLGEQVLVSFIGGQPNLGRYCIFGNLFASFKQKSDVFYRLDRHPTMSQHPVTPMAESDLRVHLATQGLSSLGLVNYTDYQLNFAKLNKLISNKFAKYKDGVLFDVSSPIDLPILGAQIKSIAKHKILAVGPSSVAKAWFEIATDDFSNTHVSADGPVLVFSGSLSPLNQLQLQAAKSYVKIPLTVNDISDKKIELIKLVDNHINQNQNVLLYLDPESKQTGDPAAIARSSATFLRDLLSQVRPSRLGLAGGDTSSYAIQALDVWGMSYITQLDQGSALCRLHADNQQFDGLEVMLKGGQMGSLDVFNILL